MKTYINNIIFYLKPLSEKLSFFTNHKYITMFLHVLLFLILFFVYNWCNLLIFIAFFLFIIILYYVLLYNILNIEKTIASFLAFATIICILFLYLRIFVLIYHGVPKPIYIENLSLFSQYRYLIFAIGSLIGLILFLSSFFSSNLKSFFNIITFPYIKEEFKRILYTKQDSFVGDACIKLIDLLFESKGFRFLFNALIIISYLIRLIISIIFFTFCFFHVNFCLIFYFIPFSFIFWIFNFFLYYFKWFLESNSEYIRRVLVVKLKNEDKILSSSTGAFSVSKKNLSFTLTPFAFEEGFYNNDITLDSLSDTWMRLASVSSIVFQFDYLLKILSNLTFIFSFFCWVDISFVFFYKNNTIF